MRPVAASKTPEWSPFLKNIHRNDVHLQDKCANCSACSEISWATKVCRLQAESLSKEGLVHVMKRREWFGEMLRVANSNRAKASEAFLE